MYGPQELKEAKKKNKRLHDTLNFEKYPFQAVVLMR